MSITPPEHGVVRLVEPLDPVIGVGGSRGRLRMALQLAGFTERLNEYREPYSARGGVWIRLSVEEDDLDVFLHPLQPHTGQPSPICRWRASFGPGCPDELIIAAVNFAASEDQRLLAEAEAQQNHRTA